MGPRVETDPWPGTPASLHLVTLPATLSADMIFNPISRMRTVRLREALSCSGQRDLCVAEPGQAHVVWLAIPGSRR